ncbi:Proline-rich receptor-like protein kinase PERK13 [Capsicum annuum]|nr:proline-rich receptor-like protein kinase PERK15 isoform X1 [Capsicum annuum]KAF3664308.1 Proline-rich receptor-like protein kinase PERK13 [Capsicum annuum]
MQSPPGTAPSHKNGTTPQAPPKGPPSPTSSPSLPSPSPPQSPPPAPPTSPPPQSPPQQSSPPPQNSPPPSSPTAVNNSPPPSSPSPSSPPPTNSQPPPAFSPPPQSPAPSPNAPDQAPRPTSSTFSPPPPVSSEPRANKLSPPPPAEKPPPLEKPIGPQNHEKPVNGSSGGSNSPPSSNSVSSNMVIIAGVAVAGLLVFAFIVVFIIFWRRKKKDHYYTDPTSGPGRLPKGAGGTDPYYKGPKPVEHIIKVLPTINTSSDSGSTPYGQALVPSPYGQAHVPSPYGQAHVTSPYGQAHVPSPSLGGFYKSQFTYEELARATSGFSKANVLGQGGFGYVHKGVLADGTVVAVKSLKSGSGQGEREFQAEVDIISRVHHRHLVSLVGYCIADSQRMLVYEYVPNKTLEFHLRGKGHHVMDWGTRLKIALGSAKGLAYLHEDCHPKIIHRDVKAANILLDDNFEAKVADFGLAKLSSDNFTHVSTRVMGTFGYLAPEYASTGKLTDKSDVFSFGVVLLELITGKRPVDPTNMLEDSLVGWARPLLRTALQEGKYDELLGVPLEGNNVPNELHRLVVCAAASTRQSAKRRPKMSQIMKALDGDSSLEDMDGGAKQGAFDSSGSSDSYDTGAYNADMIKFRKMMMTSTEEFNSSEYGATSDYGLNPSSSSGDSSELDHHKGGRGSIAK